MGAARDAKELCERHDLTFVAELPTIRSPGTFKVRDAGGRDRVLKLQRDEKDNELAVLELWRAAGIAPTAVCLEPRVLLLEYLPGTPLSTLAGGGARQAAAVARALAKAHAVELTLPCADVERHVVDRQARLDRQPEIADELKRRAAVSLDTALRAGRERTLLHGDLHSSNVLADGERLWFIDPLGLMGPAAFDVAHFAACLPADQPEALAAAGRAYRGELPGLQAWFRWVAVYRLDVSLRHGLDDVAVRRRLVGLLS